MENVEKDESEDANKDAPPVEYSPKTMRIIMKFKNEMTKNHYRARFSTMQNFLRRTYASNKQLWALAMYDSTGSLIYTKMFLGKECAASTKTWFLLFNSLLFSGNRNQGGNYVEAVNVLQDFAVKKHKRPHNYDQLFCTFGSVEEDDIEVRKKWIAWRKRDVEQDKKKNNCRIATKNFRALIEWFANVYGQRIIFFGLGVNGRTKNYQAIFEMPEATLRANENIFNPADPNHRLLRDYCVGMTKYLISEFKPVLYE
jgi:hypothetical protein